MRTEGDLCVVCSWKVVKIAISDTLVCKIFRGSMPPDPLGKLALWASQWPLATTALETPPDQTQLRHWTNTTCGHQRGAKLRNEFILSVAKKFAPFVPTFSTGAIATSDRKPKTNNQILPSPILGSAEALPVLCVRYAR